MKKILAATALGGALLSASGPAGGMTMQEEAVETQAGPATRWPISAAYAAVNAAITAYCMELRRTAWS
jgi:hypothetical protein